MRRCAGGRGCQLGQLLSSVRGRGNKGLAAHADFEGGDTFADPVSSAPVCDHLQVVFALDDDWTFESGPSFVVPHSFKEQRGPRAERARLGQDTDPAMGKDETPKTKVCWNQQVRVRKDENKCKVSYTLRRRTRPES